LIQALALGLLGSCTEEATAPLDAESAQRGIDIQGEIRTIDAGTGKGGGKLSAAVRDEKACSDTQALQTFGRGASPNVPAATHLMLVTTRHAEARYRVIVQQ
jgi:hypothetical protein